MSIKPARPLFDVNWIIELVADQFKSQYHQVFAIPEPIKPDDDSFNGRLGFSTEIAAGTFEHVGNGVVMHTGKASHDDLASDQIAGSYGKLVRYVIDNVHPDKFSISTPYGGEKLSDVARGVMIANLQPGILKTGHSKGYFSGPSTTDIRPTTSVGEEWQEEVFYNDTKKGIDLGELANLQRVLGALPVNVLGSEQYTKVIEHLAKQANLDLFEPSQEESYQMGLILAVNAASSTPFSVIALRVRATSPVDTKSDVVVGKGVMFDTGGVNLKLTEHIGGMQADMMGSAAALTTALYFTHRAHELKRDLICVLGIVENRIGSDAYCPEDVLVAYDGRTVQIGNTDAEGRLVLADCAAWICEFTGPENINSLTTIATLTGHAHLATGDIASVAIVRGNDRAFLDDLEMMGQICGDPVQRMHIEPSDLAAMDSKVADLSNLSGSRERGAMTGAAFIQAFVPEVIPKVLHLDIARATSRKGNKGQADGIPQHAGVLLLIAMLQR